MQFKISNNLYLDKVNTKLLSICDNNGLDKSLYWLRRNFKNVCANLYLKIKKHLVKYARSCLK